MLTVDLTQHLSEETKQAIRAEEIFRLKVQKELARGEGQSRRSQLWKTLNSSFIIWLLSSIVVTSASWLFTHFQQKNKEIAERNAAIEALVLELGIRCDFMYERLMEVYVPGVAKKEETMQLMKNLLKAPIDSTGQLGHVEPIFAEHRQTSLLSLVYQLKRYSQTDESNKLLQDFIDFTVVVRNSMFTSVSESDEDLIKKYISTVNDFGRSLDPSLFEDPPFFD